MRAESSSPRGAMLLTLLGGVTLGAVVMALTTPKTGREVRGTLKTAIDRLRGRNADDDSLDVSASEAMFI